jgi:hypothetical protein
LKQNLQLNFLYNNNNYLNFIFVLLLLVGIQTVNLCAQEEHSIKTDIAKGSPVSFYPKTFKVQQSKLNRKYYNNNIFDIEESDNPFALPIKGRKAKIKSKDKQSGTELLSELFAMSNDSTPKTPQWLIFVLLGLLSFMSILIAIYRKTTRAAFHAFFNLGAARNLHRDQQSFLKIESFSSYILFVMCMGTFCFMIPQVLLEGVPFNTAGALLLSIGGVAGIYILKHLQLKIIALILPFHQEINLYNFIISNTNKVLAYILIPILFLLAYTPGPAQETVLYFSLGLLAVIYIYQSLIGLAIAGSIILFHKFHFFVYLCAVEIAPILVLLKVLSIL